MHFKSIEPLQQVSNQNATSVKKIVMLLIIQSIQMINYKRPRSFIGQKFFISKIIQVSFSITNDNGRRDKT